MADMRKALRSVAHYDEATQHVGAKIPYTGERHLLLFGPNGTGKGTRFLIPNLLSIKDRSIIVIDPKGELAAVTADYRRSIGDVVMLNPFNVLGLGSAGFNPLAATRSRVGEFLRRCGGARRSPDKDRRQRPALVGVGARAARRSAHVGQD